MVLKSVCKFPKLQAQTSQFEITVPWADERKFGGYGVIMNLLVNANLSDTV